MPDIPTIPGLGISGPLSNDSAIVAPGVNDDETAGYSINSHWFDQVAVKSYICFDATAGAAVWVETSPAVSTTRRWTSDVIAWPADGTPGVLNLKWRAPYNLTVTAIELDNTTKPATAGTYLFTCVGDGLNLIEAANFDLTSLTNATVESLALQSTTPANLNLSKGDLVVFTFTADNSDLVTDGLYSYLEYKPR